MKVINKKRRKTNRLNFNDIHPRTFVEQMKSNEEQLSIEFRYWFKTEVDYSKLNRKLNHKFTNKVSNIGNHSFCFIDIPKNIGNFPDKASYLEVSWVLNLNRSIPIKKNKEFVRELVIELDDLIKGLAFLTVEDK